MSLREATQAVTARLRPPGAAIPSPHTLKLLSALLDYPREALWEHHAELLAACHDQALPTAANQRLRAFTEELLALEPMAAQERWLELFDRGRAMSLLLFEHIHGESRDRGQAMVDLVETYRRHGFELASRELPDYLPLVLEFLSSRPHAEAADWLGHVGHITSLLAARAAERHSPYADVLDLLVGAHGGSGDAALREKARAEGRDDTAEAMDKVWEEEAVRFGTQAPQDDCTPTHRPHPGRA
ncbi:MAG: nitrate reductase molybdenum cofactor assembly chaperone [Proteobacteria bacterium]|nr:nitrate reductase molybdenum cofactor assembly chaperone [Pseudomonadota bacterium]MBS0461405.1 nitrate reductase molybdenum cofactor assembly chaperone [Pseudomonadota bacterium]